MAPSDEIAPVLKLSMAIGLRRGVRRVGGAAAWFERARALEASDQPAAVAAYRRALALRPGLAAAHNNLGRLLHDRGDVAAAESHYRLAVCANPAAALYWYNLGVAIEDRGGGSEAIAAYETSLAIDPSHSDARYNLSRIARLTAVTQATVRCQTDVETTGS